jgi:hypothetical protein
MHHTPFCEAVHDAANHVCSPDFESEWSDYIGAEIEMTFHRHENLAGSSGVVIALEEVELRCSEIWKIIDTARELALDEASGEQTAAVLSGAMALIAQVREPLRVSQAFIASVEADRLARASSPAAAPQSAS